MILTRQCKFILAGVSILLSLVVGINIGVIVYNRKSKSSTIEIQAYKILENNPLIDGHNDLAILIRENFQNKTNDLDLYNMAQYHLVEYTPSPTDITRLRQRQVGGQFWSIYTDCQHQGKDATLSFMEQIDLMNIIITEYSDVFQLAKTAEEVRQAFNAKRIVSLLNIGGGQAIEGSFSILRLFYQIVDLSHVSTQTTIDPLNISQSPVIFSHSAAYSLCNHTRNVQDDVLELVKRNHGIVMVTFAPYFIKCHSEDPAAIADVAAHINYIRNIAGIDNVGIGSDFDGIVVTPKDLEDV
ncbi:unnamed protein product [Rotaria magnacalcarata]|uniref:Dipeptidase n=2 Tax=Rotaria magnacalcarata TaxID=392030 RepID=A0A816X2Y5_9BILA|nr:unnamed protein product [Rotaria magnacalcarata]